MPDTQTTEVKLTPEDTRFVRDRVAAGRYQSADDVVQAGLRLLKKHEATNEATVEDVRKKIAIGLEQAEHGEIRDGEEVFREILTELEGGGT